ncbi:MAG TPA: hypothetical protein VGE59_01280 [Patescibacteria group bacterium]
MNSKVTTVVLILSLVFLVGVVVFAFQRSRVLLRSANQISTTTIVSPSSTPGDSLTEIETDINSTTLDETESDITTLEQEAENF